MKLTMPFPAILLLPLTFLSSATARENCTEPQDPNACPPLKTNITGPLSMAGSDSLCAGRTYSTTAYTCYADSTLCPIVDGTAELLCGEACYLPYLYICISNSLAPLFNLTFTTVSGVEVMSTFVGSTTATSKATTPAASISPATIVVTPVSTETTTSSKPPPTAVAASVSTKTTTSLSLTTKVVKSSASVTSASTGTSAVVLTTKAAATSKGAAAPLRGNLALGIGTMALGILL